MQVEFETSLDAAFFALSDPTRRRILMELSRGKASVMELVALFSLTQPAISRHLKVLEDAGLIRRGRDAQRRPAQIEPQSMNAITAWIERYRESWERTYEKLDAAMAKYMQGEAP
jgi:DNA-binding transcriptional ArsR family regulator